MKATLRKQLRVRRRSLGIVEHRRLSRLASKAIKQCARFSFGKRVAVYLPFDGEINTSALVKAARVRGVKLYVPIVEDLRHSRMKFYPLTTKTTVGAFGIAIPRRGRAVMPRWLNLIIVPCVGTDTGGRRLGMGGGFYDQAFNYRQVRNIWRGPQLIGLSFDCQRVDSISPDVWDLRLDCLSTESGLKTFS